MKTTTFILISFLILSAHAKVERAILISLDGLSPKAYHTAKTPHMDALLEESLYTWQARAVYPSITLVNHTSMLTGLDPAKHGVWWNSYQPELGVVKKKTVFDWAKKQKLKTSMIASKQKFAHLNRPGSLDQFTVKEAYANELWPLIKNDITHFSPQLAFYHFRDPDSMGHTYGWYSKEQIAAIENCDLVIGKLIQLLKQNNQFESTAILISADHGGHGLGHGTWSDEDMTIPWILYTPDLKKTGEQKDKVKTTQTPHTLGYLLGLKVKKAKVAFLKDL